MSKKRIFIRASALSVLFGLSPYREKLGITFKNLLMANRDNNFIDNNEENIIDDLNIKLILNENINTCDDLNNLKKKIQNYTKDLNIISKCEKFLNCKFGKIQEKFILDEFLKKTGKKIIGKQNFKSKSLNFNDDLLLIITGTPDAITIDNEIIEIKTRIRDRLSNKIKMCDEIQLQCYLNIYEYDIGYLVEGCYNEHKNQDSDVIMTNSSQIQLTIHKIERNKSFFNKFNNHIYIFGKILEFFLDNKSLADILLEFNDIKINDFVNKMIENISNSI